MRRPAAVPFGDWLEGLIDPAMKAVHTREDYRDIVRLARSARDVATSE